MDVAALQLLPQQFNFARHILDLNLGRAGKTA